jgi:Ca2+/Na+ antiporter
MENLGTPAVLLIFGVAVGITWIAGVFLSDATDGLDDRFHLGSALGGMLLLGFAGTLPEIAITVSAALNDNLDMATGNLLGGIAMQTLILAFLDLTSKRARSLTRLSDAAEPMVEALLVILLMALALTGPLLDADATIGPVSPASIAIVVFYVAGMGTLSRIRQRQPWAVTVSATHRERDRQRATQGTASEPERKYANAPTGRIITAFSVASLATLVAGVLLERTGDTLADRWGINGAIFSARRHHRAARGQHGDPGRPHRRRRPGHGRHLWGERGPDGAVPCGRPAGRRARASFRQHRVGMAGASRDRRDGDLPGRPAVPGGEEIPPGVASFPHGVHHVRTGGGRASVPQR